MPKTLHGQASTRSFGDLGHSPTPTRKLTEKKFVNEKNEIFNFLNYANFRLNFLIRNEIRKILKC